MYCITREISLIIFDFDQYSIFIGKTRSSGVLMNWDFCWLYSEKFIKRSLSHKIYMKFVNHYERRIISKSSLAYGRISRVLFSSNLTKSYLTVYTVPFPVFSFTDYSTRYGYDVLFRNIWNS